MYGLVSEAQIKSLFREEQVKALYESCLSSVMGSVLITSVLYWTYTLDFVGNQQAGHWFFLVWLIAILRAIDSFLFLRTDKSKRNYSQFLLRFASGSILAALGWALLFWTLFPVSSLEYQALILIVLTAIPSFATTTLSFHLGIIVSFLVLLMLPIELRILSENTDFYSALSYLIPLYFLFQLNNAKQVNKQHLDNIRLQIEFRQKKIELMNQQYALDQHAIVSTANVRDEIISVNDKFLQLSQYTESELLGQNHIIAKSKKQESGYFKSIKDTITKGNVWHGEIKNHAKDGTAYWVDTTIVPFLNEQGRVYQYIAMRTDITKLKALEQKNNNDKNDALIRAKVAQILQGQSPLKERMVDVLDAISKAEGLHIQNKLGMFLLPEGACELQMFVTHGQYTEEFLHKEKCVKLGECLCGRAAVSAELIVSDDCMTDPLHEHKFKGMSSHGHYIVPLMHNGKVLGILFIYTDPYPSRNQSRLDTLNFIGDLLGVAIANERVNDELLEARKSAEKMAQVKSDFLANMSHEIRTPMNGVLGMLDLLKNRTLDDKSRNYVDIAQGSARMLLNVINDILDISKVESGKLQIENMDFDLRKAIEDTADLLSKLACQKNLELSVFIPPDLKNMVRGDVLRLQQVLNNLICNAIKFTEEGEVSIILSTIEEQDDRVRYCFEIKDTGIGIAAEKQNTLFQAFMQADSSTSRQFGGTGLGLTISKKLVAMMGGEIGLSSEMGKGSTFWFELPFEHVYQSRNDCIGMSDLRILTIDDNETTCLMLTKYIESCGAEIIAETIPEIGLYRLNEALEKNRPFDVLLLDSQMPNVTGEAVVKEIRQNLELKALKIIMLSPVSVDLKKQPSFDFILDKPIRQLALYDAIESVLHKNGGEKVAERIDNLEIKPLQGKVLFVDDNIVNQQLGKEMLLMLGLDFEMAGNGKEALELRKTESFQAILMDCQMPVMDGFESTRQIRQYESQENIERINIIALTANVMQGDCEKSINAGMDRYLTKPYTIKQLYEVLFQSLTAVNAVPTEEGKKLVKEVLQEPVNLINVEKFEETSAMMGEKMAYIVTAFIETGLNHIDEMKLKLDNSDFEGLRDAIHALKGSCGIFGMQELYEHCDEAEVKCRLQETKGIDSNVNVIALLFDESRAGILALMSKEIE